MKFTSKSPYVGILNFVKKSDFFLSFYQCFKILNFAKKKDEKTIEKDTEITIDNVIFKIFSKKKSFYQKSQFFD